MSVNICRASDPATCKYHGTGRKTKIFSHRQAEAALNAATFSYQMYSSHPASERKLRQEVEKAQEDYDATTIGFAELTANFYNMNTTNPVERQSMETRLRKASLRRQAVLTYTSGYTVPTRETEQVWLTANKTNSVQLDEFTVVKGDSKDGVHFTLYIFNKEGEVVAQANNRVNDVQSLAGLKHVAELYLSYNPKLVN